MMDIDTQSITPKKSIFAKIAKSTGGLTCILTGIKVLGYVEKKLLAYYFGTGYQVDAYVVGFQLMKVFWEFARGLLSPSYLPTLIGYRATEGEAKSWEFTSTVFNLMSLVFVGIVLIGLLFTPQIVSFIAPGFIGERLHAAVGMTRLMLTGAAFFAIAIVTGLTLNSYKRFLLAVADDVVFKVSGLVGLALLAHYIGIYGLGWGIAVGSWIAPLVHLIGLRKYLPFYKLRIDFKLPPVRKMFRLMAPLVIGIACFESRRLIDNFFASTLVIGSVAALEFGYRLIEFAYVAIAEPLAVVILPYFSDMALEKDHGKMTETLMTTLRTVILMFTPMGVCLFMLREPVVRLLFGGGKFDDFSTQLTVTALTYYAFGIVSFAVDVILTRFYFSMSDTTTPAIMEAVTIAMHVGIIYTFIGTLNHGSIALAFTLSKTVKVLVLYGLLKKKIENIQSSHNLKFLGKVVIVVGIMMVVMSGYQRWFTASIGLSSLFSKALLIGSSGSFGILVFLIAVIGLRVQEIRLILQAIRQRLNHIHRRGTQSQR
jgi:putative peptidoglycan lipid II flippase